MKGLKMNSKLSKALFLDRDGVINNAGSADIDWFRIEKIEE